jgi:hypothetical protein
MVVRLAVKICSSFLPNFPKGEGISFRFLMNLARLGRIDFDGLSAAWDWQLSATIVLSFACIFNQIMTKLRLGVTRG